MARRKSFRRKNEAPLPYPPGQRIPYSGIYVARHYAHRTSHELTLVQGDFFPFCRKCGEQVKFVVLRMADRLREDYDFSNDPEFLAETELTG